MRDEVPISVVCSARRRCEARGESRDVPRLEIVDGVAEASPSWYPRYRGREVVDGVHDGHRRLGLLDLAVHGHQMLLEAEERGARARNSQTAVHRPTLEIDADRPHVPHVLAAAIPRRGTARSAPRGDRSLGEVRGEARLAGAGGARDEDAAAAVVAVCPQASRRGLRRRSGSARWAPRAGDRAR